VEQGTANINKVSLFYIVFLLNFWIWFVFMVWLLLFVFSSLNSAGDQARHLKHTLSVCFAAELQPQPSWFIPFSNYDLICSNCGGYFNLKNRGN
jgi:hypothetical protein